MTNDVEVYTLRTKEYQSLYNLKKLKFFDVNRRNVLRMKEFDFNGFLHLKELEIGYVDLNNKQIIEGLFIKIKRGQVKKLIVSSFTQGNNAQLNLTDIIHNFTCHSIPEVVIELPESSFNFSVPKYMIEPTDDKTV